MQVGVIMFVTSDSIGPAELAGHTERLGFESLWFPEHPAIPVKTTSPYAGDPSGVIPHSYSQMYDPFVALSAAAAVTTRIKLATGICLVPERNPIHLAKEAATLDRVSNGRFLLGIGSGWLREETELFGVAFKDRVRYTRESVLAMKELWTKPESEYHGQFVDFPPVKSYPKPIQQPHPPVLIGGKAERVLQRVAAWGDGWMPTRVTPEQVAQSRQELDRLAAEKGRGHLPISVFGASADPELLRAYEKAGAERVMIFINSQPEASAVAELEGLARKVLV